MYYALPYWRYGTLPESSHESTRGRLAGLTPVLDDLPPAPPVSQEAEQSKYITQEVCSHDRRVRLADDPSAQLRCTPSSPSARPALALKGCGDGPATMTAVELRRMLLLISGCGLDPSDPDDYAYVIVDLLPLAREWRIAGDASGADIATSRIEGYLIEYDLLDDSARTELLQCIRAFQSSASLPFCPACEAECFKVQTISDLF